MVGEGFGWSPPGQDFAWSRVERVGDSFEFVATASGRPTLRAQAEHAERNQQTDRAAIYNRLLNGLPADTG